MAFTLPTTSVALSDHNSPGDVIDAIFLGPFLAGEQPVAHARSVEAVSADTDLVPHGAHDVRLAHLEHRKVTLSQGEGWTLHVSRWRDASTHLTVTATTDEIARRVLDEATRAVSVPESSNEGVVTVGFWSQGRHGPMRRAKSIDVRPWSEIAGNYGAGVTEAFGTLMDARPSGDGGRLLLFHGPPGTGKTTALRALAHGWADWCDLEYVLDPERLLANPGYLMEAAAGDDEDRWRLLVLEDCDELIRADAKAGAGQALARLLNLTDGILGQGMRALVAITTNEPLARLHPAIVRPGRCLAQVEVGRLTPAEARRWLGQPVLVPAEGWTLAELLARSTGDGPIEAMPASEVASGYL